MCVCENGAGIKALDPEGISLPIGQAQHGLYNVRFLCTLPSGPVCLKSGLMNKRGARPSWHIRSLASAEVATSGDGSSAGGFCDVAPELP